MRIKTSEKIYTGWGLVGYPRDNHTRNWDEGHQCLNAECFWLPCQPEPKGKKRKTKAKQQQKPHKKCWINGCPFWKLLFSEEGVLSAKRKLLCVLWPDDCLSDFCIAVTTIPDSDNSIMAGKAWGSRSAHDGERMAHAEPVSCNNRPSVPAPSDFCNIGPTS